MFSRQKGDDAFVRDRAIENEGGELDAKALAALPDASDDKFKRKKKTGVNDSASAGSWAGSGGFDAGVMGGDEKRNWERDGGTSDAGTAIEGLAEFEKYGTLFRDLTTRQQIHTNIRDPQTGLRDREADVVAMAIAYDSSAALAIVTGGDEHFEL
jgi:hypothetical protein